nr:transposase [Faecalicoccus acidiformans]
MCVTLYFLFSVETRKSRSYRAVFPNIPSFDSVACSKLPSFSANSFWYYVKKMDKLNREFVHFLDIVPRFNQIEYEKAEDVQNALENLISRYQDSDQLIFYDFSRFLESHKEMIIHSFTRLKVHRKTETEEKEYYSRLSNGPMESFNRKPKDYKRNARGFSDFHYTRNRILLSMRRNPAIKGVPRPRSEFKKNGAKRGCYNKTKLR